MLGMFRRAFFKAALGAATSSIALGAAMSSSAYAQEQTRQFNIPSQTLSSALMEYSRQSEVVVVVPMDLVRGKTAPTVQGSLTPTVALERLLAGSGLSPQRRPEGGLTLVAYNSPTQLGAANSGAEDEIVVTGTHIPGEPVGVRAIVIDREQIQATGQTTLQGLLANLPQNSRSGAREDFISNFNTREGSTNAAASVTLNLRGIGASATLVLVDGRRLAPGGTEGVFSDVSSIPISAIERVEVLTDGASAIYGSDAIGGVVNVILRKDYTGAETLLRYGGATASDMRETQASQSFGTGWESGNLTLSYEFYDRQPLLSADRGATANSDLRPLGGSNWSLVPGNPGTIVVAGRSYAIPHDQNGQSLTPSDFTIDTTNFDNSREYTAILPEQTRHSIFGSLRQDLPGDNSLTAQVLYSTRDNVQYLRNQSRRLTVTSVNPFYVNPTGGTGPVAVRYNLTEDLGPYTARSSVDTYSATLGVEMPEVLGWSIDLDGSIVREEVEQLASAVDEAALSAALVDPNPATAFNPFGDGSFTNPVTLEAIRSHTQFTSASQLRTYSLVANRTLFALPAGEMRLAVGGEYRVVDFETLNVLQSTGDRFETDLGRDVTAAFAEVRIPLVAPLQNIPGISSLEASLAVRREEYSDFGVATTPRLGLEWSIDPTFTARASWSESFKAPNLSDLSEAGTNSGAFIDFTSDPSDPSGFSPILLWSGTNADLGPERANTWSIGFDFAPSFADGFRTSITYFSLSYTDRIEAPPFGDYLLDPILAPIVTLNPTQAQRQVVCDRAVFFGDPADCMNADIVAIVDGRLRNTATNETDGLDIGLSWDGNFPIGDVSYRLNATHLFNFSRRLAEGEPNVDLLDTPGNPVNWRISNTLSWSSGRWDITGTVHYTDSYADPGSGAEIDSWTTTDFRLAYALDNERRTSVELIALNLFNAEPPFYDNPLGVAYDPANSDPVGRVLALTLRRQW